MNHEGRNGGGRRRRQGGYPGHDYLYHFPTLIRTNKLTHLREVVLESDRDGPTFGKWLGTTLGNSFEVGAFVHLEVLALRMAKRREAWLCDHMIEGMVEGLKRTHPHHTIGLKVRSSMPLPTTTVTTTTTTTAVSNNGAWQTITKCLHCCCYY